jgi:hypothetical protein
MVEVLLDCRWREPGDVRNSIPVIEFSRKKFDRFKVVEAALDRVIKD